MSHFSIEGSFESFVPLPLEGGRADIKSEFSQAALGRSVKGEPLNDDCHRTHGDRN
jgi:hypothetical protein